MDQKQILQFYPFSSIISPNFWERFTNLKLHKLKLNTDPVPIDGIYSRRIVEGVSSLFHIQCDDSIKILSQCIPQEPFRFYDIQ
ncbi:hypothetical protein Avbf_00222 [Armadillidium vulgare]|nr:hypothetical protein Avbf_00222 [Armadillidium vulgare]